MALTRQERLALIMSQLEQAEPASDMESAYELLCDTMNSVEDAHSGVPFDPGSYLDDGRLYPPLKDARRSIPGRDDLIRFRSKGHNTFISSEGAIRIQTVGNRRQEPIVFLDKPGKSGKYVET